jgi:hypothetical protein
MNTKSTAPKQKRYWYFVTGNFFGDSIQLRPRIPHTAGEEEPRIKRICVAPTIAHCLSAVVMYDRVANIYRTKRRVNASKCWGVGDSEITKEHWLFRPTEFELVGSIDISRIAHNMEHRGYAKSDGDGYLIQKKEKRAITKFLARRDQRLARIGLSDTKWTNPKLVVADEDGYW